MLFGTIRVNKPSAATSDTMGPKLSRDHSPTASFHRHATSNSRVASHSSSAATSNTREMPRISVGRVSTSYLSRSPASNSNSNNHNHSGTAHDDRLRRTGRRKLVLRGKAHSDPGADKQSLLQAPHSSTVGGHANDPRTSSRVHGYEPTGATRSSARSEDACCSKCTRAGMEWDKYRPSAVVKDYAAVSTQNSKFRKHMEDECVVIPKFKVFHGDPAKSSFFGVYDGHGGSFCARYAAKNFHTRLSASMAGRIGSKLRESDLGSRNSMPTSSDSTICSENDGDLLSVEDIESCFAEACATLDQELARYDESSACGSTAVTCLIRNYNGRTSFHVANIGDSRAILFANGRTSRLTVDHKATNEDEVKRIRAHDGIILNKRVGGVISVTRAFGQTDEKKFITADPHTQSGEVEANDSFLVLASDGVTDVFSDEEITEFVAERLARGEKSITICKSVLDEAKAQGAMDNMTAVLICFSDLP